MYRSVAAGLVENPTLLGVHAQALHAGPRTRGYPLPRARLGATGRRSRQQFSKRQSNLSQHHAHAHAHPHALAEHQPTPTLDPSHSAAHAHRSNQLPLSRSHENARRRLPFTPPAG